MKLLAYRESSVVIATVLVVAFFGIGTNGDWFDSIPSVLRLTAQIGIVAIGQAILMTAGEVDLSVGAVFAYTGVVFIETMERGVPLVVAALVALLLACGIGLLNALFTIRFKVPSMIVTLGAMFVFRGLTYLGTRGQSLSISDDDADHPLVRVLRTKPLGLNLSAYLLVLLAVFFVFVLAKTRFGSHATAVGNNATSAQANGVSPGWTKTKAFVLCAGIAGLSAILVVFQEGTIYSTSGVRMEVETIAAAVIGGCSLRGGIGSIWGAVLGVFVLSSLKGGLILIGAPTSWYIAFVGAILISFLVVASVLQSRARDAR